MKCNIKKQIHHISAVIDDEFDTIAQFGNYVCLLLKVCYSGIGLMQ